jgi:vacuolar-type H+-ATPase subunit E/Vma4
MTNSLLQKITTEAETRIAAIAADAQAAVAEVQTETETVIQELQQSAKVQLQKKKDQIELVANAKANQAAKIAMQAAKREAIDGLFAKVTSQLLAEAGAAYVARYTARAQAVLPKDIEVVSVAAPADKADETKEILSALDINVAATTDASVRAGLIITTKDGVYDVSFDRMMSEVRPSLEMELVQTSS